MLKKLTKSILVTTSVIAGAALPFASPSHAGGKTKLISYTPTTIAKVGVNGSGTAYQQTGLMQLSASADVYINAGIAGHVKDWKRWLRVRTENSSWVNFSDDGVSESYPPFHRPQIVKAVVGMDVAHDIISPLMVMYCNSMADDLRTQGKSNEEIFSQDRSVPVFIDVAESTNYVGIEGGQLPQAGPEQEINLICKGRAPTPPVHTADHYSPPPVDFKIKDINLFLTTFSGANTQPNAATTCKKGQVKVRLKATKAGATKFKLWTQVGAAPMASKVIDAWASDDGAGGYEAEHVEWVSVDKTSTLQAKAEEMISGFGMSTNWEDITLQCKDMGGSGLATNPDTSNPNQPVAPPVKYSGELTLADSAKVERNQCPRQGQAVFKINSSSSAAVSYSFDCTNGESWQGNMQMFANGPGKFQGVAAKTFDVDKTENVACVLKRVKDNKAYLLTAAAKQYVCANTAVDTGSDDLVQDTNPVDPPVGQTLKGDFGFVDHGSPKCTRQGKALLTFQSPKSENVHYSLDCKDDNYSGVTPVAPNPAGGYSGVALVSFDVEKTLDESCTLRTVAPYGPKEHVTKSHLFQCVNRAVETGSDDLAPDTNPVDPVPPQAKPLVAGDFAYIDPAAPKCARNAKALISLKSNKAGDINFELDCKHGYHPSGVAKTEPHPAGGYIGVVAVPIGVDKTFSTRCALKTKEGKHWKTHTTKGHTFQCIRRIGETGANDLQVDPKPTSDDQQPAVIVDPVREVACVNGRAIGDMCLCKRGDRLVKTGTSGYRCDTRTPPVIVTPVPDKTIADPARTDVPHQAVIGTGTTHTPPPGTPGYCQGGTWTHDGCKCAAHKKLVPIFHGRNKFQKIGAKCVLNSPGDKTTVPGSQSVDRLDRTKSDAIKRRLEAAKKVAEEKRKRDEAIIKARKVKAAQGAAKKAAIAKRKRDLAIIKARKLKAAQDAAKKAAAAKRVRDAAIAKRLQAAQRATAAKRLRDAAAARKRVAPAMKRKATPQPALRRRAR